MPTSAAQLERQKRQRQALIEKGWSSDCARNMHDRCHLEGCPCKCHNPEENARSAGARRAWETRRAEQAPKRPEVRPGVKAPVTAAVQRQIKSEFSLVLYTADQAAAKLAPKYWTTPEDRLADDERTSLVNSSYAVLEAYFPELLKILAKVSESAPLATFIYTVAMVAAPRLAHHKVISPELASAIVFAPIIFQQATAAADQSDQQPASVESEPALEPDRADGNWEEYVSGAPVAATQIQDRPEIQARHGEVRHGADDPSGQVNGRFPL